MGDSAKSAEETYLAYKECLAQNNRPRAGLNLMVAAIMGYLPAQAELGYKYLNGILFPKDYTQAMRWLSAAAEKEDTDSVVNLAIMYMYGYGTKTDGPKAVSTRYHHGHRQAEKCGIVVSRIISMMDFQFWSPIIGVNVSLTVPFSINFK